MIDTITLENGHEYPSRYAPPTGIQEMDEAWEILDRIKPGEIPVEVRSYLAGIIAGTLRRYKEGIQNEAPYSKT